MAKEIGINALFPRFDSIEYGEADEGGVDEQGLAGLCERKLWDGG